MIASQMFSAADVAQALGVALLVGLVAGGVLVEVLTRPSRQRRRAYDRTRLERAQRRPHAGTPYRDETVARAVRVELRADTRPLVAALERAQKALDPPYSAAGGSYAAPRPSLRIAD